MLFLFLFCYNQKISILDLTDLKYLDFTKGVSVNVSVTLCISLVDLGGRVCSIFKGSGKFFIICWSQMHNHLKLAYFSSFFWLFNKQLFGGDVLKYFSSEKTGLYGCVMIFHHFHPCDRV